MKTHRNHIIYGATVFLKSYIESKYERFLTCTYLPCPMQNSIMFSHTEDFLNVLLFPMISRKNFGRVIATFRRLSSSKNPSDLSIWFSKLLLTALKTMMSFSLPWKASTVFTSRVSAMLVP